MKKIVFMIPVLAFAAISQAVDSNTLLAADNATVQPGGPRSGASGKNFLNIEGSSNGNFASYGVVDFNGADFNFGSSVDMITGLKLSFVESNASFTAAGDLRFFVTQNTADIQPGTSPLFYDAGAGENGVGSQLAPMELLGTGVFSTTGNVNSGTVDTYVFDSLSANASAMLWDAYQNESLIRIVVAPESAGVAATWAGFSNTNASGPVATLTGEAVPEPATMTILGLGALAMIRRRRAN